eukprot:1941059-Rhodomonas_salina.1
MRRKTLEGLPNDMPMPPNTSAGWCDSPSLYESESCPEQPSAVRNRQTGRQKTDRCVTSFKHTSPSPPSAPKKAGARPTHLLLHSGGLGDAGRRHDVEVEHTRLLVARRREHRAAEALPRVRRRRAPAAPPPAPALSPRARSQDTRRSGWPRMAQDAHYRTQRMPSLSLSRSDHLSAPQ